MCHKLWISRTRGVWVAGALLMALSAVAHAQDATSCKKTLASETAKFERAKLQLLQTCEDQKRNGTLPANTDCVASNKKKGIAKLIKTAQNAIKKSCGKQTLSAIGFGSDGSTGNPVLAKACSAGDFAGARCARETDCPGICANGGEKEGQSCSFNSSCADHACAKGNCIGGKKNGQPCATTKDCGKGGFCPTGEAPGPPGAGNLGSCNGGTNDQGNCAADSDCPGTGAFCDNGCNTGNLLDNKNGLCEGALCSSAKDCGLCTDATTPFFQQSCAADADCGKICSGGSKPGDACKAAATDCPDGGTCNTVTSSCKTGTCSGGFCAAGSGAHGRATTGLCAPAPRCPNFKNDFLPGAACNGGKKNGLACTQDKDCGKLKGVQIKCEAGCGFALNNAIDVGNCLICIGDGSTTDLNSLYYGDLAAAGSDAALESCKTAVGKAAATFFDAKRAALATCEASVLGGSGTCPDGTATSAIDTARAQLKSDITAACSAGLTAEQIAIIFTCPAVTIPGASASCAGASNRGPVSTVSDLADCLACVTDFSASCTDRLSVPATGAPFTECNSLCGNGRIDGRCSNNSAQLCASSIDCPGGTCVPFETCDDGNPNSGDACPGNCSIAACSPSGNATMSVTFTAPTALGALSVFVEYPDGVVSIPGVGTSTDKTRFDAGSLFASPNDLDYAVRVALLSSGGDISSPAFSVLMDTCSGAAAPTAGQFRCHVESASDTNQNVVSGVTCAVALQ